MNRGLILGLIFFIAIGCLAVATLIVGHISFHETYPIAILFDDVKGIKVGTDVHVDGLPKGVVKSVELELKGGVLVSVDLDEPIVLYEDYKIYIEEYSIIGGSIISITRGKQIDKQVDLGKITLTGRLKPKALEVLAEFAGGAGRDFSEMATSIKDLTKSLKEGKGTLAKLLSDDTLYNSLTDVATSIKEGEGALHKLIYDKAFGEKISTTFDTLSASSTYIQDVMAQVREGKGTLTKLIYDETFAEKLSTTFDSLGTLAEDMKKGEGLLGKLTSDKEFANKIETAVETFSEIAQKVKKGEGSLGKLIQDEELYNQAKGAVEGLNKTVGKAAATKVYLGTRYDTFAKSDYGMGKVYLKIQPSEDKYFNVGGSVFSFDTNANIGYEDLVTGNSQQFVKPDVQLAYRIPWFLDNRLWVRAGMLEGKPGGALDLDLEKYPIDWPIFLSVEGRDAYNSVGREDIDEDINGPLIRAYLKTQLARDGFFKNVKLYAGVNRIGGDAEFMAGIGLEYEEEDIRTLVSLVGLSR